MENKMIKLCKCGCGREIMTKPYHKYYGIPKYIHGHNKSGGEFKKGNIPWMKGKKTPEEVKNKISKANKGYKHSEEAKKKISLAGKGRKFTEETKLKISLATKGNKNCLGRKLSDETKRKIGLANSIALKGRRLSKETIIKCCRKNPKSSLEIKFENIINKLNLPYKFVGNGDFLVGRKCPDFVNTNGKKLAVEVFYRRHKEQFAGGLKNWMINRTKIFKVYGWNIAYFNEIQVNEKEILMRLG